MGFHIVILCPFMQFAPSMDILSHFLGDVKIYGLNFDNDSERINSVSNTTFRRKLKERL